MAEEHQTLDSAQLFRRHGDFVARFLVRLGVARSDVEDLLQDVFLVAHRGGGFEPGPARPTTYLAAIALRVATSHRRKRRTRAFVASDDDAVARATSPTGDPARNLETRERLARTQRALDQIDPQRRAIFILFELDGEPCTAIAGALRIPIGTVYSRLHAARKIFREALERELDGETATKTAV